MGVGERLGGGAGAVTLKRSFPPVVDAATRVLVLGSLPGDASLRAHRYYAHPANQFWQLLSRPAGVDLPALAYEEQLAALLARGIGLWDVIAQATRPGSSDAAIRDVTGNDLPGLVAQLPALRAIAFNGGTALRIGLRALRPAAAQRWAVLPLPSSSPLHTVGLSAKQPAWDAITIHL